MNDIVDTATSEADQAGQIDFFWRRAFPGAQRIETHTALLFLHDDRAWKLKKAVDLGYLDFTSLSARHTAISNEFTLNRRNAPEVYLATHPVCVAASGEYLIGTTGRVVDWLLEMRRLPDDAFLDRHLQDRALDASLLTAIAQCIFDAHRIAPPSNREAIIGLRRILSDTETQMQLASHVFDPVRVASLLAKHKSALDAHDSLLSRRTTNGRVRRCHGDLHLSNIAIIDGRLRLLDCLEFDEDFATVDVLYDLAFLLMDLCALGKVAEARTLAHDYLGLSPQDKGGIPLLPLFTSMRAAVRAHVAATRARDDSRARDEALGYFATAIELMNSTWDKT